jgi:muramidase (phage lysozyme)
MGGKTGTSTASTSIPPEVLARYNAVNKQAQDTAGTPFQQYSSDPNAFVAPLNEEQQAATGQTNQYANAAQPAINYAQQGFTPEGFQQGVQGYMNPFLQNAMGATAAQMNNINQQEQQKMIGSAIGAGAFGGDRANIGLGNLENQQNLAMGQTLGQMANQGYQNAAQNYMTGLGQIGNLGIQGQQAGLQGAQAMMGAGTLGQQTTQAGKSALYNQFQQQQAYPFQVAQFLANIAEGTGALSGSTTTQTSPQSFFSDVRLKEDIKKVGTAHNGLPIYTFKYKGDNTEQTHIGYMAQDVEKVHPEAVGESHGFKTVDYDKASEPAHKYAGGVVGNSEGGAVMPQHMGQGFAVGGDVVSPTDLSTLIAQQQQSFAPFQQAGIYGGQSGGTPHGGAAGVVPAGNLHVAKLQPAQISSTTEDTGLMSDVERAENVGDRLTKMQKYAKDVWGQAAKPATAATATAPAKEAQSATGVQGVADWAKQFFPTGQARGGVVGYAGGGEVGPYATDDPMSQVVSDTEKDANRSLMKSPIVNQKGNSTFGDLMSLAALPGEIAGMGSAASSIGSGIGSIMTALAPVGLATGGRAGFEDGGDPETDSGLDSKKQYKIAPQNLADMDPVQQQVVKGIYGPESGSRYNILNGGEQFDNTQTHPHRIGKNGQSTAAGAGQFIGSTWDNVTGGAPMTPGYQDAATWKLASDDYNRRTGRNLHEDVAQNGFSPEVKFALAPTWTSLGNAADKPAKGAVPAQALVNGQSGFQAPEGDQQPSAIKGIGDALSSNEHLLIPLLSGLGAMAGSKSRYLGSAILEGIGAGAGAYENVQQNIAQRGLTNAQKDVQSTLAAGNAQTIAQNSMYKGADGQTYVMTAQGPMISGLWQQALAQGKYIPTVGYDQMVQMIAKIPGAQPISQGNAGQPTDPNAPRPTQAVPGMPTGNEPATPPNPYTGVGHAGNAAFDSTYQQSFLDQPTFQTKKAVSDQAEVAALAAARAAQGQGAMLNQLSSAILKAEPNSWNAVGQNNEFTRGVTTQWNDIVGRVGGSFGASPADIEKYKFNPEDVGSQQAADKMSAMLQFAQAHTNDASSLGALQTAARVVPSTANSYEGAVDILAGLYVDKQKAIDQNNYINEYKKLATQKGGPVFANRYLVQDALNAFAQDHSDNQYGKEKESLKKALAHRAPDKSSSWAKLYSSGKPDTLLDEAIPGLGRYLRSN